MKSKSFREFLGQEFNRRTKSNSNYSIRAFARDLSINDSTLSQLIHGKRPLTSQRIIQIGQKIGLSSKDIERYVKYATLVRHDDQNIELEVFNQISEWYCDAIIELIKIPNIQTDPKSIATVLGITSIQARMAMDQLRALKIIIEDENGKLICNQSKSLTSFYESVTTTETLKNYQKQMLELSQKALVSQPRSKRNHTTYIIAIDSNILDEVNMRIRKFQHDLANFIENNGVQKDKVYGLQFSSFEITKTEEQL